jgi:hypothetical protein
MIRKLSLLCVVAMLAGCGQAVETQPLPPQYDFAANVLTAADLTNANAQSAAQANIVGKINSIIANLNVALRDDNQIRDGAVRLWTLGTDVLTLIGSGSGWQAKPAVDAVTTTILPAYTATPTTLTAITNGALPAQDGYGVIAGQSLLVQSEAAAQNDGIYTVTQLGSAGTPWILTRRADCDTAAELGYAFVYVNHGSTNGTANWLCTVAPGAITLGTTPVPFIPMGRSAASTSAGVTTLNGLSGPLFIQGGSGVTVNTSGNAIALSSNPNVSFVAYGTTTPRTPPDRAINVWNVLDFGATTLGGDCSAAITAAIAAIVANDSDYGTRGPIGTIYFPAGDYYLLSPVTIAGGFSGINVTLAGEGARASVLHPSYLLSGDAFVVAPGAGNSFSMRNLGWDDTTRVSGARMLTVSTAERCIITDCDFQTFGGMVALSGITDVAIRGCRFQSGRAGLRGDGCLSLTSCGGIISDCSMMTGNGAAFTYDGNGPPLKLDGCSRLQVSNCRLQGGGPGERFSIAGITSDASHFVVSTTAAHTFLANDIIAIHGASLSGYNGAWRVGTVTGTTVSIFTTINPGTATATGNIERRSASLLISNGAGASSQIEVSNTSIAALTSTGYGTASILVDGTRGGTNRISNVNINNCSVAYGVEGIAIRSIFGTPTVCGVTVANVTGSAWTRGVSIEEASSVSLSGISMECGNSVTDNVVTGGSIGLFLTAASTGATQGGISVSNCRFGPPLDAQLAGYAFGFTYGAFFNNANRIQRAVITGSTFYGTTAAVFGPAMPDVICAWVMRDNILTSGTAPESNVIPTIASATTMSVGYADTYEVTGTTSITFLPGGWWGRKLTLMFDSAVTLNTGGDFALGANYNVLAGQQVTLTYTSTGKWFVK